MITRMMQLLRLVPQPCEHEFNYMRDMTGRNSNGYLACKCQKCDQTFWADCGLNLPGKLVQR